MSAVPEGRRLLRLEVRNAETPIERKPDWIKTKAKIGPEYSKLHALVKEDPSLRVRQDAGCSVWAADAMVPPYQPDLAI